MIVERLNVFPIKHLISKTAFKMTFILILYVKRSSINTTNHNHNLLQSNCALVYGKTPQNNCKRQLSGMTEVNMRTIALMENISLWEPSQPVPNVDFLPQYKPQTPSTIPVFRDFNSRFGHQIMRLGP